MYNEYKDKRCVFKGPETFFTQSITGTSCDFCGLSPKLLIYLLLLGLYKLLIACLVISVNELLFPSSYILHLSLKMYWHKAARICSYVCKAAP